MKALVTGASGFLGSHIVDACLRRGDEVRALVRAGSDREYLNSLPEVTQVTGDLTDPAALAAAVRGVEVVYHAAARVADHGRRSQFVEANVVGTRHLLMAAREAGVGRFVFVSSPSVVADGLDQLDIDESYPYPARFLNLYSETKAAAEQLVLGANGPGFSTCAIRPRGVWGPRDWRGAIPKILARLLAGRLPDMSGGRTVLASLCHCDNAAEACLLAARSDRVGGRAYFITDGERTDVWAFIRLLAGTFHAPPPRRRIHPALLSALTGLCELLWRLPFLASRYPPPLSRYSVSLLTRSATYDTRAAARDLGYRPIIGGADGLLLLERWVTSIGGLPVFLRFVR